MIWGYSAIMDESKYKHVVYLVLLKLKPMSKELASLVTGRILNQETEK